MYFTGSGNFGQKGVSPVVTYLQQDNQYDAATTVLIIVGVEHLVLLLKYFIDLLIPDIPKQIVDAEFKRKFQQHRAREKINEIDRQKQDDFPRLIKKKETVQRNAIHTPNNYI